MPVPLDTLSRPALAARITTLADALDTLGSQARTDGGPTFTSVGALEVEWWRLVCELRRRDTGVLAFVAGGRV